MTGGARRLRGPRVTGEAGRAPVAAAEGVLDRCATAEGAVTSERFDLSSRGDGAGVLGDVRVRLERAESLLLRPSALSAGQLISELEECCRLLAAAEWQWRGGVASGSVDGGKWMAEALEWRRSLRRLERLTAGASSYCQGWAMAAGLAGGYTAAGVGEGVRVLDPQAGRTG
jgi:hypothetical protein